MIAWWILLFSIPLNAFLFLRISLLKKDVEFWKSMVEDWKKIVEDGQKFNQESIEFWKQNTQDWKTIAKEWEANCNQIYKAYKDLKQEGITLQ